MTRSEDGLALDDGGTEEGGALLLAGDGLEVRESHWAGAYYCAHVLWLASKIARAPSSSIARDRQGDPLVGFLHVPADADTAVPVASRPRVERHGRTAHVVACALRGIVDELSASDGPIRVLLTGFGPFAAVVSNPTGDFVDDDASIGRALGAAVGAEPRDRVAIIEEGARLVQVTAGSLVLGRMRLDVDDAALDPNRAGSLPWALARFKPHALVALGVHRASSIYRVEIEPTDAGLLDGDPPRHERGRPLGARERHNRALARAIVAGAAALARS